MTDLLSQLERATEGSQDWEPYICMSNVGSNCDCLDCRDGRELRRVLAESKAEAA